MGGGGGGRRAEAWRVGGCRLARVGLLVAVSVPEPLSAEMVSPGVACGLWFVVRKRAGGLLCCESSWTGLLCCLDVSSVSGLVEAVRLSDEVGQCLEDLWIGE